MSSKPSSRRPASPSAPGSRSTANRVESRAPLVKCPTCGRQIEWSEAAPFRPFCSERCRLIDLGAWLSEQRAIPADSAPDGSEAPLADDDQPNR
jgi:endogenous inhibitor of DNA gyrase (YacG/DUF329 family)